MGTPVPTRNTLLAASPPERAMGWVPSLACFTKWWSVKVVLVRGRAKYTCVSTSGSNGFPPAPCSYRTGIDVVCVDACSVVAVVAVVAVVVVARRVRLRVNGFTASFSDAPYLSRPWAVRVTTTVNALSPDPVPDPTPPDPPPLAAAAVPC